MPWCPIRFENLISSPGNPKIGFVRMAKVGQEKSGNSKWSVKVRIAIKPQNNNFEKNLRIFIFNYLIMVFKTIGEK